MLTRIRIAAVVVIVAAAMTAAFVMARYGVNIPVGDEIPIGQFLVRNHDRAVPAFSDLIAQHNESRKFFPRLIFFYLARLTGWNLKWQMVVSFVLACLTVFAIGRIARRTFEEPAALAVTATSAIILFSPIQWWNWLSGIQIVAFTPLLMLTAALLALASGRIVLAAAACVVATFSYASGMILWILLLPSVWVFTKRISRVAVWVALCAAAIAFYFYDYTRPRGHPPLVMPYDDPFAFVTYCLAFLGHPLAWKQDVSVAATMGGVLVAIFVICGAFAMRSRAELVAALPWITIGGYAIGCSMTTAMGRLPFGIAQAMEARYTTFSVPLLVGTIGLAALALRRVPRLALAAAVALIVMHLGAVHAAWPSMIVNYRERLMARALVHFALVNPDRAALSRYVLPNSDEAIAAIDRLDRIRYLSPRAIRTGNVLQLDAGQPGEFGAINEAVPVAPSRWRIGGWAALPGDRPADTVLVARITPEGEQLAGIASRIALRREDIGGVVPALRHSGWSYDLRTTGGASSGWSAWAYDGTTRRAYRLANTLVLPSKGEETIEQP